MSLEQLKREPLVLMQEGAGVRQVIEDELREMGVRLRDLDVRLELGLQESARTAVLNGFGVTFISRDAIEADVAAGSLAVARVEGLEPSREILLVRSSGRAETRVAAGIRRVRAGAARLIVRWGLDALPEACGAAGVDDAARRREPALGRARAFARARRALAGGAVRTGSRTPPSRLQRPAVCSRSAAAARSISARRSRPRPGCRSSRCRRPIPAPSGRRTSAFATRGGACTAAAGARIRPPSSTSPS